MLSLVGAIRSSEWAHLWITHLYALKASWPDDEDEEEEEVVKRV